MSIDRIISSLLSGFAVRIYGIAFAVYMASEAGQFVKHTLNAATQALAQ